MQNKRVFKKKKVRLDSMFCMVLRFLVEECHEGSASLLSGLLVAYEARIPSTARHVSDMRNILSTPCLLIYCLSRITSSQK